jgi:uncharacterized protein YqgV (UPF0045/DUF77 family)
MGKIRFEFTVEPFTDGAPGPHVRAAIEAVTAAGLTPDIGPFGTTVDGPEPAAFDAVRALLAAAFAHGATRVSVQVTDLAGGTP